MLYFFLKPFFFVSRTWSTDRIDTWRVPFLVRFQRTVLTETTLEVHLCPDDRLEDPLCTITAVAAIIDYRQYNTQYSPNDPLVTT